MAGGYENRFMDTQGWQNGTGNSAVSASGLPGPHDSGPHDSGFHNPGFHDPGFHDKERLPWLDSIEDEFDDAGYDPARVWVFILVALALMVSIIGGVWWAVHRGSTGSQMADGSIIAAPPGSIKVAPQDPGGKTFDGTGDSSFAVSQGHGPSATLADGRDRPDDAAPEQVASTGNNVAGTDKGNQDAGVSGGGSSTGSIGVQVGAFSTQLAAENAWTHLAKNYDALSTSAHRIVEGKADIGTVYRLQVVAGSDDAATALCERLKAAGLNCQVKD